MYILMVQLIGILNPDYVLLTSENEDADIRLLDLGLSKIIGPNQKCIEPYGTLTYCAPEIILDKPYLKTVKYLLLSGSLPFTGKNEHEFEKMLFIQKQILKKKQFIKIK